MGKSVQYTRRFLLASLLTSAAGPLLADAPLTSMRPKARAAAYQPRRIKSVEEVIAESGLTGKVGFVVADADTGKILSGGDLLILVNQRFLRRIETRNNNV